MQKWQKHQYSFFSVPQAYKEMILGYVSNFRLYLLVSNAEDNSPPGDFYFLKVINQLHETMPSYAKLVFHMFKCQVLLTAEVVS